MTDSDKNNLSGRLRRYAKVGGTIGGLASKMATARLLGRDLNQTKDAQDLEVALGGLKGPLMKVAQLLATVPDALPSNYVEALGRLQTNAPPMGWPFVRRRLVTELGKNWDQKFEPFDRQAAHAASLGQVHKAKSLEGQNLACKLQYPDMLSTVEADLKQLKLVFSIYERGTRSLSTSRIHQEIAARLREELDYDRERRHMELYSDMLKDEKHVCIPKPIANLSTPRLITMTWLDGKPLLSFKDEPLEVRNLVAENMFRAWYVPFYHFGVIHGDPHLGNYTIAPNQVINLLDFGCIRIFHSRFVKGVIDLYEALRTDDEMLAAEAYACWGFKDINKDLMDVLNIWAKFIYSPLLKDKVTRIQESENGLYGAQVATKVYKELRRVGGVTPPREFVFMDRAAIGLGSVFLHLKAEINWHKMFNGLIEDFRTERLQDRQSRILTKYKLPLPE